MNHAEIVRDYVTLRKSSKGLTNKLVKLLSRDDINKAARDLGMLQHDKIVLETEDEIGVLMDYALANIVREGRTAIDRALEEDPPPEGSPELTLLRSWQKSHYTVLEIVEAIPGVGVQALDGPEKTPILVVDIGFSKTMIPGRLMASRIKSPGEGWWMTTGAALPVNEQALKMITHDLEKFRNRHGRGPDDHQLARFVTRACVAAKASQEIVYADLRGNTKVARRGRSGSEDTAHPGTSSKLGRNDPCPCGSGKKYKKCCGMFPARPR